MYYCGSSSSSYRAADSCVSNSCNTCDNRNCDTCDNRNCDTDRSYCPIIRRNNDLPSIQVSTTSQCLENVPCVDLCDGREYKIYDIVQDMNRPDTLGEYSPIGDKGPKGKKGETTEFGHQGEPGDKGPIGPQGDPGPPGDHSEYGLTGDQGPQGLPGAPGGKGPKGETGPPGEHSEYGLTGEPGIQGPMGFIEGVDALKLVTVFTPVPGSTHSQMNVSNPSFYLYRVNNVCNIDGTFMFTSNGGVSEINCNFDFLGYALTNVRTYVCAVFLDSLVLLGQGVHVIYSGTNVITIRTTPLIAAGASHIVQLKLTFTI